MSYEEELLKFQFDIDTLCRKAPHVFERLVLIRNFSKENKEKVKILLRSINQNPNIDIKEVIKW